MRVEKCAYAAIVKPDSFVFFFWRREAVHRDEITEAQRTTFFRCPRRTTRSIAQEREKKESRTIPGRNLPLLIYRSPTLFPFVVATPSRERSRDGNSRRLPWDRNNVANLRVEIKNG